MTPCVQQLPRNKPRMQLSSGRPYSRNIHAPIPVGRFWKGKGARVSSLCMGASAARASGSKPRLFLLAGDSLTSNRSRCSADFLTECGNTRTRSAMPLLLLGPHHLDGFPTSFILSPPCLWSWDLWWSSQASPCLFPQVERVG